MSLDMLVESLRADLDDAPIGSVLRYSLLRSDGGWRERTKHEDGWHREDGVNMSSLDLAIVAATRDWALWHAPDGTSITLIATNQEDAQIPEALRALTPPAPAPKKGDLVRVGPNPQRHRHLGGPLVPSSAKEGHVALVRRIFTDGDLDLKGTGVVRPEDVTIVEAGFSLGVASAASLPTPTEADVLDRLDRTAEAMYLHPHREPTGITLALNLIAQVGVPEHLMLDALDQAIWLSRRTGMTMRAAIEMNEKARILHQATEREQ